jgi:hypothetical protein
MGEGTRVESITVDGAPRPSGSRDDQDDDRVPVFGAWARIYAAVVVVNLIAIALARVLTRFPY